MLQIYHNPRCKISRQVLDELRKSNVEVEVIEYLKVNPTLQDMKLLLAKLHLEPQQIIRTNEKLYKKKFRGKTFNDREWLQILLENPILIERPIVVRNNKALICRPPERIKELI